MTNKTSPVNIMLTPEAKAKLKQKADEMGISITQLIEKIAIEDICFLDSNFKKAAKLFNRM